MGIRISNLGSMHIVRPKPEHVWQEAPKSSTGIQGPLEISLSAGYHKKSQVLHCRFPSQARQAPQARTMDLALTNFTMVWGVGSKAIIPMEVTRYGVHYCLSTHHHALRYTLTWKYNRPLAIQSQESDVDNISLLYAACR